MRVEWPVIDTTIYEHLLTNTKEGKKISLKVCNIPTYTCKWEYTP